MDSYNEMLRVYIENKKIFNYILNHFISILNFILEIINLFIHKITIKKNEIFHYSIMSISRIDLFI